MTGHRSIEALRTYERVSTDQQKAVSKVLMANASFENVFKFGVRSHIVVVLQTTLLEYWVTSRAAQLGT